LVAKAFSPKVVTSLAPRIEAIVAETIEKGLAEGGLDAAKELAMWVPLKVIGAMVGVEEKDGLRLKSWSDEVSRFVTNLNPSFEQAKQSQGAVSEMIRYLRVALESRRVSPKEDFLSGLIQAEEDGTRLSDDEILATCAMILFAGHETTTSLVSNALYTLSLHDDQLELLRKQPKLAGGCVEELLRYDGPVHRLNRVAKVDFTVGGREVKAGQRVVLLLAAGNRDPKVFVRPDSFEIRRSPNPHFGFGRGIHFCPGAPLARIEAESILRQLFTRAPQLRFGQALRQSFGAGFRGPRTIPLEF
jgi:cytochrome P450